MNILVTGGSSGLGKAIVEMAAKDRSNTVFLTYSQNSEAALYLANSFPNVVAKQCDFSIKNSLNDLLLCITEWDLDVLINNAYSGNPQGTHFHKQDCDSFLKSFQVNVLPVIQITQKVLETFRKKKSGKIITILTTALFGSPPIGYSLYAANKAYIQQLSKSWSREYIKYGITSNCVSPNFMQTTLTKEIDERIIEQMQAEHPLKRLLTPQEVAECVCFLVNTSNQINGVNIPINAGIAIV